MTGFEVLAWLRQRSEWNGLPVVILTGSCYEPDVKHAYELGANSFLTKPNDFSAFVGTVKQMAHFWLGKASLPERMPIFPCGKVVIKDTEICPCFEPQVVR